MGVTRLLSLAESTGCAAGSDNNPQNVGSETEDTRAAGPLSLEL